MSNFSSFDHLFDAVLVLNVKKEIIYFNHHASVFFKLPPRVLKQKNSVEQICDSHELNIDSWLSKALLSFEVLISPEIGLYIPHSPETEYHVVIKLVPIQHDSGVSFAVVFHDLTVENKLHLKYKEQLEELKQTHKQVMQADKLSTLGEVTANISHEINNPLTIASGNSEIIRDYLNSADPMSKLSKLKSANGTVIESLERVNQIIKNMKDFLHQSEDQKEYCDLNNVIDAAIEWTTPSAKNHGIKIVKEVKVQGTVALANKVKLEQVLINLIKNSLDALVDEAKDDSEIRIILSKSDSNNQTWIDVIDNGPGLSQEIKTNLFTPFVSTKSADRGTGLGLSICSKIIEGHKGRLEYMDSEKGCHFKIRLPLIELYSYTRNDKSLSGSIRQKRILVLDNEVQILNVLNTFLQDEGYVFIGSTDPQDALDFLSKAGVDLILTDFSMPKMNGKEFVEKSRRNGFTGPILYMTSSKNIEQFNKDKAQLNLSGLIVKPFNKDDVMKTLNLAFKSEEVK